MQSPIIINATQPRHKQNLISLTIEQINADNADLWQAVLVSPLKNDTMFRQIIDTTTVGDLKRLISSAIAVADAILDDLTPLPAAPAPQPTRKAKKTKAAGCQCPRCRFQSPIEDGVYRCRELQAFAIYFDGLYRGANETHLEATITLNTLKHPHLRQVA